MATVKKVTTLPKLAKKKRVAAYARVSSEKDTMMMSLSNQVSYYSKLIQSTQGWEFAGIYADEAKTGTKDTRPEFVRMINDATAGKIDMIITKSISRFARNTVTLLETTRELKKLGIDVFFEKENLHSMSSEGEMMLSIIASVAQEESRQVSENMKWRIKQDYMAGIIWGGKDCLGYRMVDKQYIIVPEEAEIVRQIYQWYIEGMGDTAIAKKLYRDGVPTFRNGKWGHTVIMHILTNISYTGNLILQKTYVDNHINKVTKINKGEYPMYFVEDTHEPIISMDTFQEATRIRKERSEIFNRGNSDGMQRGYIFTGMIFCGNCGWYCKHRKTKYREFWICKNYNEYGKDYCQARQIPQDALIDAINAEFGYTEFDEADFRSKVEKMIAFDGNRIMLIFKDGSRKDIFWKDRLVRSKWTEEMREQARQHANKRWHGGND